MRYLISIALLGSNLALAADQTSPYAQCRQNGGTVEQCKAQAKAAPPPAGIVSPGGQQSNGITADHGQTSPYAQCRRNGGTVEQCKAQARAAPPPAGIVSPKGRQSSQSGQGSLKGPGQSTQKSGGIGSQTR